MAMRYRLRPLVVLLPLWAVWTWAGWLLGSPLAVTVYNYKQTPDQAWICSWILAALAFVSFPPLYWLLESLSSGYRPARRGQ
jgi:hypothetical protein